MFKFSHKLLALHQLCTSDSVKWNMKCALFEQDVSGSQSMTVTDAKSIITVEIGRGHSNSPMVTTVPSSVLEMLETAAKELPGDVEYDGLTSMTLAHHGFTLTAKWMAEERRFPQWREAVIADWTTTPKLPPLFDPRLAGKILRLLAKINLNYYPAVELAFGTVSGELQCARYTLRSQADNGVIATAYLMDLK